LRYSGRSTVAIPSGADASGTFAMGMIALAMFIGLWMYGQQMFGWSDPNGDINLAIFVTFILGIICGYRVKD
jgi:uncharacterized membrane protein (DUF4010 family)